MSSFKPSAWICVAICSFGLSVNLPASDDDLGSFQLGQIPSKSVWHGMPYSFLVQWEKHPACEMTVHTNPVPAGTITLEVVSEGDPGWWKFTYNPDSMDKFPFTVILTGTGATESLSQAFDLDPMAVLPPEQIVFDPSRHTQSGLIEINDPAPQITTSGSTDWMNHQLINPRTVLIRRQEIVMEDGNPNNYYLMFNNAPDIRTMEMIAETVIIRSALHLPETNVLIRARELRMEGPTAAIITTPNKNTNLPAAAVRETINADGVVTAAGIPGGNGKNGLTAGIITLEIEDLVVTDPGLRFDLRGGPGQDGGDGIDGTNGTPISNYWKTFSFIDSGHLYSWSAPGSEYIIYEEAWVTGLVRTYEYPVGGVSNFPTSGTDAEPSGKPGKGGAGGTVKTTLPDISIYVNTDPGEAGRTSPQRLGISKTYYKGGSAGLPNRWLKMRCNWWGWPFYDLTKFFVTDSYNNHGGPTTAGVNEPVVQPDTPSPSDYGTITSEGNPFSWMDPVLMDLLLHRARDQYLNGQLDDARIRLEDLSESLSAYMAQWLTEPTDTTRDLKKMYDQMQTLLNQIYNNLDYYGNPAGWVPMLSFEVNTTMFDNEINRAIDMLYLAHWIGNTNATQTQKRNALKELSAQLITEIEEAETNYNEAMLNLGTLKTRAAEIRQIMEQRVLSLQALENQLEWQADLNTQTPWWKTGLKMASVVCKVVPLVQPAAGYIGAGMDMAVNFDPDKPYDTVLQGTKLVDKMVSDELDTISSGVGAAIGVATGSGYGEAVKVVVDKLGVSKTGLTDYVTGMKKALDEIHAPADKINAELERLKALSPEFKAQAEEIEELQKQHGQFARDTAETILKLVSLSDRIQENLLAMDTLREDLASVPTMDARAVMYIQDLKRRAVDRLQKYHYYMAKAYEFRLLKPYTQPLNLDALMDEFANTAIGSEGNVIPADQFNTLKGIYKDAISTVAEEIFTLYNNNRPEMSAPVRFNLTTDELAAVNDGLPVQLNLMDMGIFPPADENVRIVNFQVYEIETESVGGPYEQNAYVDLKIEHCGLSRLMSDGQTYLFRHYNRQMTNPITWGARYFPADNDVNPIEPSAASASLLKSLLSSTASADMMIYSRPSAWADLDFSLSVYNNAGKDINLKKLRMELQYDFMPRNSQLRLCDIQLQVSKGQTPPPGVTITSAKTFMPYFRFDTGDKNLRCDARGWVHRIFPINSFGLISITAQSKYGNWKFNKWTNQYGQDLNGGPWLDSTLKFVPSADKVFAAQYVPLDVLAGDLNFDCCVDLKDFAILSGSWLELIPTMDLDNADPQGWINLSDLLILIPNWQRTCEDELKQSPPAPSDTAEMDERRFEFVESQ